MKAHKKKKWKNRKIADLIKGINKNEREAFLIWCEKHKYQLNEENRDDIYASFESAFLGKFKSKEIFVKHFINTSSLTQKQRKKLIKYLFMVDYWIQNGYIFKFD